MNLGKRALLAAAMATLLATAALAQPAAPGDVESRRERDLSRQRLTTLLDSLFGSAGYHAELIQGETGLRIVLVVDSRFQGEYDKAALRELIASLLGVEFGAQNTLVLSSMPLTPTETAARRATSSPGLLGAFALVLVALGAAGGWYARRLRTSQRSGYRDALDRRLERFRQLADSDPARVAQVLRMWLRPAAEASARSGGMTQRELAAVLLLSLPKESAAGVLRQFLPKEVQQVGDIMVRIARVRRTVLRYAVVCFFRDAQEATGFGVKSESEMRELFEVALGESRSRLVAGLSDKASEPLFESLRWLDLDAITELVTGEHPQLQAVVLASLEAERAAQLLDLLPANHRADLLMRVADLDKLQPAAVQAVAELIEKKLRSFRRPAHTGQPGQRQAASILKSASAHWAESLIQDIHRQDQPLAALLQEQMFAMDDLLALTAGDWQKVQQQLSDDLLARALLGCRPDTREGFLRRLPRARARRIQPLLKRYAGVGAELIQQSANEVLVLVRRMAAAGDIVVGGELRLVDPASVE